MHGLNYSLQNVADGQGVSIAITGMAIVFTSLTLICIVISLLPKLLSRVEMLMPEDEAEAAAFDAELLTDEDDLEVVAAIGLALHARMGPSPSAPA